MPLADSQVRIEDPCSLVGWLKSAYPELGLIAFFLRETQSDSQDSKVRGNGAFPVPHHIVQTIDRVDDLVHPGMGLSDEPVLSNRSLGLLDTQINEGRRPWAFVLTSS